jgi:hypothetical protein
MHMLSSFSVSELVLLSYHTFRHSSASIRSSPRAFRSGVINRVALRKASYLAGQISKALTGVRRGGSALEMGLFVDAVKVWGNSGESYDLCHFWRHLHYLWPRRTPHRLPRPRLFGRRVESAHHIGSVM